MASWGVSGGASQNPKHIPESKNTSQNPFRIVGSVFGFWDVFLDSGMFSGFWKEPALILGRVLVSGKCFVPVRATVASRT